MKIVIDIPENIYEAIKDSESIILNGQRSGKTLLSILVSGVWNGTPLPKTHGRLIDADWIEDNCSWYHSDDYGTLCYAVKDIDEAPTIIEAESEVDNGCND